MQFTLPKRDDEEDEVLVAHWAKLATQSFQLRNKLETSDFKSHDSEAKMCLSTLPHIR